MISAEKEALTRRLLEGGKLSWKKIGKLVGISSATVKAVTQRKSEKVVAGLVRNVGFFSKQVSRCPQCGASAYFPEDSVVCYECLITNDKGAKNERKWKDNDFRCCKSNG